MSVKGAKFLLQARVQSPGFTTIQEHAETGFVGWYRGVLSQLVVSYHVCEPGQCSGGSLRHSGHPPSS